MINVKSAADADDAEQEAVLCATSAFSASAAAVNYSLPKGSIGFALGLYLAQLGTLIVCLLLKILLPQCQAC